VAQYVYVGGGLIAEYTNNTTHFVHTDHLGSTRLVTALNQSVSDNMDYLPYGLQIAGASGTTHKFTGKERDAESGLDNFGARYNASTMGRFMSADPSRLSVFFTNPQSWNR
jgi:RHS repeat-associated protein